MEHYGPAGQLLALGCCIRPLEVAIGPRLSLRATAFRRALRAALGPGAHDPDGRPISRSASLRVAFRHARALAKGDDEGGVYLL